METQGYTRARDEDVIDRYGPAVYRLAFAQMRNKADAEDVFQEVFLRFVSKSPEFEGSEHEKAWFLRVTLNCCRDQWRAPWRRLNVPLSETLPFEDKEEWCLHRELLRLPKKYRAPLHLFYWEDLSTAEIAGILSCSPAAVRQRLSRGRAMLKKLIDEGEIQHV